MILKHLVDGRLWGDGAREGLKTWHGAHEDNYRVETLSYNGGAFFVGIILVIQVGRSVLCVELPSNSYSDRVPGQAPLERR